jgi:hypothetical protein
LETLMNLLQPEDVATKEHVTTVNDQLKGDMLVAMTGLLLTLA